jgi:hypothetical protein
MDHSNIRIDLQGIDDPKRVPPMPKRQRHHTGTEARKRFGDIRHAPFGKNGQCPPSRAVPPWGKSSKSFWAALIQLIGCAFRSIWMYVVISDNECQRELVFRPRCGFTPPLDITRFLQLILKLRVEWPLAVPALSTVLLKAMAPATYHNV